jgi:hypothetical protein
MIFGSLDEMPLSEILPMLSKRVGKLRLSELEGDQRVELYLNQLHLKGVAVNGVFVVRLPEVRQALNTIRDGVSGKFDFVKFTPDVMPNYFDMPIMALVLENATNELEKYRPHFPDPRTRFRAVPTGDVQLDLNLLEFWRRSSYLLRRGASPAELAHELILELDQVQLSLHKLRLVGKVAPFRAFEASVKKEEATLWDIPAPEEMLVSATSSKTMTYSSYSATPAYVSVPHAQPVTVTVSATSSSATQNRYLAQALGQQPVAEPVTMLSNNRYLNQVINPKASSTQLFLKQTPPPVTKPVAPQSSNASPARNQGLIGRLLKALTLGRSS